MINKKVVMIIGIVLLVAGATYAAGVVFFGGDSQTDTSDSLVLDIDLTQDNYVAGTKTFGDDSREGNDGVSINAATFTINKYGKSTGAMSFNGTGDYIDIPDTVLSNQNTLGMTFAAWVNLKSSGSLAIVGGAPSSSYSFFASGGILISEGKAAMITYHPNTGYKTAQSSFDIQNNTWTHIVGVHDPSIDKNLVYVDGIFAGEATSVTETVTDMVESYIGYNSKSSNRMPFNGSISEVKIWNRALSATEVKALYNSSKPKMTVGSSQSGLVGHWALNSEGYNSATNRVTDKTPYENHGTNSGATLTTDRMGHSNGSMNFDGIDDYIGNISAISSITTGTPFTLCAWVNPKPNVDGYRTIMGYDGFHRLLIHSAGRMLSQQSGDFRSAGNGDVPNNQWTHVIYWNNGTTERWYLNGAQSGSDGSMTVAEWNSAFKIGQYDLINYKFNGSIADVRIYNRALSANEINTLYNSYNTKAASDSLQKGLVLDMPLTSHWTKGGAAGSQIMTDKTPYTNDGQNHGATVGSSYTSFDGNNDYIDLPNSYWAFGKNAFSISVWGRPINADSSWNTFIETRPSNLDTGIWLGMYNYKLEIYGSVVRFDGTTTLENNTWYHVTVVGNGAPDGSRNVKVYLNGVQEGSTWTTNYNFSNNRLRIGDYHGNSLSWGGDMSNVKVYNRSLSDSEIKLLYARGRQ